MRVVWRWSWEGPAGPPAAGPSRPSAAACGWSCRAHARTHIEAHGLGVSALRPGKPSRLPGACKGKVLRVCVVARAACRCCPGVAHSACAAQRVHCRQVLAAMLHACMHACVRARRPRSTHLRYSCVGGAKAGWAVRGVFCPDAGGDMARAGAPRAERLPESVLPAPAGSGPATPAPGSPAQEGTPSEVSPPPPPPPTRGDTPQAAATKGGSGPSSPAASPPQQAPPALEACTPCQAVAGPADAVPRWARPRAGPQLPLRLASPTSARRSASPPTGCVPLHDVPPPSRVLPREATSWPSRSAAADAAAAAAVAPLPPSGRAVKLLCAFGARLLGLSRPAVPSCALSSPARK